MSARIQYTRTSKLLVDEGRSIAKASTGPRCAMALPACASHASAVPCGVGVGVGDVVYQTPVFPIPPELRTMPSENGIWLPSED
jgi:hypothetical protein